jgi:hypothetical protein
LIAKQLNSLSKTRLANSASSLKNQTISNKKYLPNKAVAEKIASSYMHLIGDSFNLKHQNNCTIDRIDVIDEGNDIWDVVLVHNIFKPPCIPEFYGFRCPTINLFEYLTDNHIEFDSKAFGL